MTDRQPRILVGAADLVIFLRVDMIVTYVAVDETVIVGNSKVVVGRAMISPINPSKLPHIESDSKIIAGFKPRYLPMNFWRENEVLYGLHNDVNSHALKPNVPKRNVAVNGADNA